MNFDAQGTEAHARMNKPRFLRILSMAEGNSKLAKRLRADASKVFERVQAAYEGTDEGSPQTPPCRPA